MNVGRQIPREVAFQAWAGGQAELREIAGAVGEALRRRLALAEAKEESARSEGDTRQTAEDQRLAQLRWAYGVQATAVLPGFELLTPGVRPTGTRFLYWFAGAVVAAASLLLGVVPLLRWFPCGVVALARCMARSGGAGGRPYTAAVARSELVVQLDEALLGAVAKAAAEDGVPADAVVEAALRRYFGARGLAVLAEIAAGSGGAGEPTLGEDEATVLAVEEVRAHRAERRRADAG